ncbi:unnamed protein product [Parnassius apollo]|uniref:(apollo) hypothetical protein n=1 Tax=Parnassius apollo TaxID=110799 RepID=A0A8S3Y805_PARAO|nr:unnamed protein product [Parnassius apollo]
MSGNTMLNYVQSEIDVESSVFNESNEREITVIMEDISQMGSTEDMNDMFLGRPSKKRKANRYNECTEDNVLTRITEDKIECKRFNENGFKCQKTLEISQSYGVIKDIGLELSEEEILLGLKSETLILAVKRLKRKNTYDGHWEHSESIRICFKGSSLPSFVYIYDTRVKVSPYTYPMTQCSRCWRFGHSIRMCPSLKVICPKCTKSHPNCETTTFKCNNCMGKHMAMAKICPVFLKEKRIRELMAEFNCSYKKALMLYVPPSRGTYSKARPPITKNDPPLLTQPTSENESSQQDKQIPGPSDVYTYASVTKTLPEETRKSSKSEKRRNRRRALKEQEKKYA